MSCDECPNKDLADRVSVVERDNIRVTTVLENLQSNLTRLVQIGETQIRLEERQISQGQAIERAFKATEDLGKNLNSRVKVLEESAPTNNMASKWVFGAVMFIVAGVGAYIGGKL